MTKLSENYPVKVEVVKDRVVKNISRRGFLGTAGIVAVGGMAVAAGNVLLAGNEAQAAVPQAAPPLPWRYTKLDPLEAGKRGYKKYLERGG